MFKRFFRRVVDFFKRDEPVVIKAPSTNIPVEPLKPASGVSPTIGIVVGHNERGQGATNYLKESEWVFNKRIANKLVAKLAAVGINAVVILRPSSGGYSHEVTSVMRKLRDFGCKFSIHLHFNSAGKGAMGVETLVADTSSPLDNAWAKVFSDILNETYGFVERRDDGVFKVKSGHRGSSMLYAAKKLGIIAVLVEPCFGDYRTKESALIFEQEDKYVDVLRDAVVKTWK